MSGKMSRAPGPKAPRSQEDSNIYYYQIRASFGKEILSFRHEIEKSSFQRTFADLLIIKNRFVSSCLPEVCNAFLLFVIIPVTTSSAE